MSKKANPTVIGAFVVGATILLAVGVAVFGGAELFASRAYYIAYFPENTKGLRRGSSVTMNGSQIGYVSDIVLLVDHNSFESTTAVTMEILPQSWQVTEAGVSIGSGLETEIPHEELVAKGGLRAQLQTESLVTGQLLVEISFDPGKPLIMRGGPDAPYPEIPTMPSNIQQIISNIQGWVGDLTENIDARDMSMRIQSIVHGLDELSNSPDLREALAGANSLLNSEATQRVSASLGAAMDEVRAASSDAGVLLRNANTKLDRDLPPAVEKIIAALDQAEGALAEAKEQMKGESMLSYQLTETLREIEGAAHAMNKFFDYLERNPEALLKGKQR